MKLTELLENQRLTIQLLYGEQKIEFFSNVIEKNESLVYVSPYLHNGSELELNIAQEKGVICNLYTNDPWTKHRISWKNVELTTVTRNDKMVYCLRTNGYNHVAKHDDRRKHDRIVVQAKAKVLDGQSKDGVDVIVHDISDIGISFYAPKTFSSNTHQLTVIYSEMINDKKFDVKVECTIARITKKAGNQFVGCRITKENKNYQLYCFMKRLTAKNKNRVTQSENSGILESPEINDISEKLENSDLPEPEQLEVQEEE